MRALTVRRKKSGFTIVEFMVATMVFSVILLGVTAAILEITRIYQRSINDSSTQAAARNLVDSVAQAVQFSAGGVNPSPVVGGTQGFCIGNREFLYVLGRKIGSGTGATLTRHAAMTRSSQGCEGGNIVTATPSGSPNELLSGGMRLARFSISQSTNLYTITVKVVYGDDDLLCSTAIAGSCEASGSLTTAQLTAPANLPGMRCKATDGSQFCSVSELSTTVQGRL